MCCWTFQTQETGQTFVMSLKLSWKGVLRDKKTTLVWMKYRQKQKLSEAKQKVVKKETEIKVDQML